MPSIPSRWTDRLSSPLARIYILLGYLSLVALLGGGSRDDIQSLIILRPLALIACAIAALQMRAVNLQAIRVPLLLLAGFIALHVVHLIPLPPGMWEMLPRRDMVAGLDDLLGQSDRWRPLTFSPAKTTNSLFALFVPLGALMLFSLINPQDRIKVFYWLVLFALVSAVFGIMQLLGPASGPLYLYDITNEGRPVGLFSNRNHQSALLACAIAACFWIAARSGGNDARKTGLAALAAALVLMFLPLVFITGSRAGLLLSALAIGAGLLAILRSPLGARQVRIGRRIKVSGATFAIIFAAFLFGIVVLVLVSARDVAFARLFAEDNLVGLRASLLPVLGQMVGEFWVWGAGMGAFEFVYPIYEPLEVVSPRYLNEAHNDWAQVVIEGGVVVIGLLLALLIWLASRAISVIRQGKSLVSLEILAALVVILLGIGSVFDYPLRVPSLAAIFAIMLGLIASASDSGHLSRARD